MKDKLTKLAITKINLGLEDIKQRRIITFENYAKKRGISL